MAVVVKDITINFQNPQQQALRDWLKSLPAGTPDLPPLSIRVSMNVDVDMIDDDEIAERYEELFGEPVSWAEKCYRMIARGENDEAMDLIYRESGEGLAPPSTEKRIAALLTGQKVSTHAEN